MRVDARRRLASPRGGVLVGGLALLGLLAASPPAWAIDPTAQQEQREQASPTVQARVEKPRPWSVWGIFETHFAVVRDNLPQNDIYHYLYLYGNYDPPRFWRIPALGRFTLRLDLQRKYVADPGESGFLFGDLRLYWSHPFRFAIKGQEFSGRGYFYWTFPTSKVSQLEGNIARPTLLGALSKQLPFGLEALFRPHLRLNWARYAEAEGGAPNQKWMLGYDLWLIWTLPWHKPLSVGGIWGQDWISKYDARDGQSQPWNSEYFWEVFASYQVLERARYHVDGDLALSLTSGRKTMEDGVWKFHFFDRDETEMYLTMRVMY